MIKTFVTYVRVSSAISQKIDGHGISAQTDSVRNYAQRVGGAIIGEFSEAESGANDDRPQLKAAMEMAKKEKATLLTARIDRISRDAAFIIGLRKTQVEICCVDMPEADFFQVSLFAVLAERERMLIAERTRLALQAAKRRGVKLGNPHVKESVALMNEGARAARINFRNKMSPVIEEIRKTGVESYSELARILNIRGICSRTGKKWFAESIKRVMA